MSKYNKDTHGRIVIDMKLRNIIDDLVHWGYFDNRQAVLREALRLLRIQVDLEIDEWADTDYADLKHHRKS